MAIVLYWIILKGSYPSLANSSQIKTSVGIDVFCKKGCKTETGIMEGFHYVGE